MRRFAPLALVVLMALFGLGVYHLLGLFRTDTTRAATRPNEARTRFALPGTLFIAQDGVIYRLHGDRFVQITQEHGWMQPSLLPDGRLLAVSRAAQSSDVYVLDADGAVAQQLTDNAAHGPHPSIDANHWSFYPMASSDGSTLYTAYDKPKQGYLVILSVWSQPLSSPGAPQLRWTTPYPYTGGDIMPVPLASGGILYAKYALDTKQRITSRVFLQTAPKVAGTALTSADDDCLWPSLSPDQHWLAMVCTGASQQARLEVAPFDGSILGPARVLVDDRLTAAPVWSPDGSGLAYLAPASAGGGFQLWWVSGATSDRPGAARQVTDDLALDATSRPAWSSR